MSCRHLILLMPFGILATACDPGVYVSSKTHLPKGADVSCIRSAIVAASAQIYDNRGALVPEDRPDPGVEQIEYGGSGLTDPAAQFGYMLQIRRLPDGTTSYSNQWRAIGTHVPPEADALVRNVDLSVQRRCGLPVGNNIPDNGPGVVSPD
jgi:hypothetical protein